MAIKRGSKGLSEIAGGKEPYIMYRGILRLACLGMIPHSFILYCTVSVADEINECFLTEESGRRKDEFVQRMMKRFDDADADGNGQVTFSGENYFLFRSGIIKMGKCTNVPYTVFWSVENLS